MPKRNLHVVNPSNPHFGICERCNARFTSFAYNTDVAASEVKTAFDEHKCFPGDIRAASPAEKPAGDR